MPNGDVTSARARGSIYIDGLYGRRFPGVPTGGASQDDEWPRTDATDYYGNALDPNTVPARVVNAAYEATLLELAKPDSLTATLTPDQRKVLTEVSSRMNAPIPSR